MLNRPMIASDQAPTEGEIVEGKVIAVTNLGVVVDFGRKSEGLVPAEEFIEAEQGIQFGAGQTIEVQITGEHKDGYAILSHQRARRRKVWADLEKAYHDKSNIKVKVVDRVKGGVVVDAGRVCAGVRWKIVPNRPPCRFAAASIESIRKQVVVLPLVPVTATSCKRSAGRP